MHICHLIGPDTPPERVPLLRWLASLDTPQSSMLHWRGGIPGSDLPGHACGTSVALPGLAGKSPARTQLERADIVHVWSAAALRWYRNESGWSRARQILAEFDGTAATSELPQPLAATPGITWLARHQALVNQLIWGGVPETQIRLVEESAPPLPDLPRAAGSVVVAQPPGQPEAFFESFWGTLVAHKVVTDTVITPLGGRNEVERVRHLARSAQLDDALRIATTADHALATAELLIWTPARAGYVGIVQRAIARGLPVVVTEPVCRALPWLQREDVWLVDAVRPSDIARGVVQAWEDPQQRQERAARAQQACPTHDLEAAGQGLCALYRRAQKKDPSPPRARVLEES